MANNKFPFFKFFPNDWLSSTKILSMSSEAEAGYLRLLCHSWNDPDCGVSDDDEILARLTRLGESWKKCKEQVLACFEHNPSIKKYINKRILEEKEKCTQLVDSYSARASKAAKARWEPLNKEKDTLVASPKHLSRNACDILGNAISDIRYQKSDIRSQISEARSQKSEFKSKNKNKNSSERSEADHSEPKALSIEPFKTPEEFQNLTLYRQDQKLIKAWPAWYESAKVAYPGVDILAEVRKAHAWEVANPSRIKKNRIKFFNSWMVRAQDQGPIKSQNNGQNIKPRETMKQVLNQWYQEQVQAKEAL